MGQLAATKKPSPRPLRGTFSGSNANAVPSGSPSTACRTVGRCSGRSARPGLSAVDPRSATPRSAPRKAGCAAFSTKRAGTLPGLVKTGATFSEAADEWLRYVDHDRDCKPSTIVGYKAILRAQLLPAFGDDPIESITTETIESWLASVDRAPATRTKALVLLHGIFKRARKVYGLPTNPAAEIERPPMRQSVDIDVFSLEEVLALVRAASSTQDAAIYLTAAFTGLRRGELLALR
jgi:Phage integrase, N-terminal SAM-like domain